MVMVCDYGGCHVCARCAKLTTAEYKMLSKREDLLWGCTNCIASMKSLLNNRNEQGTLDAGSQEQLISRLDKLEEKLEDRLSEDNLAKIVGAALNSSNMTPSTPNQTYAGAVIKDPGEKEAFTSIVKDAMKEHVMFSVVS